MPGVCILGDKAKVEDHVHGGPCCPHVCVGPAVSGSPDVMVNGMPAVRLGDVGIHAACCGPNIWRVIEASGRVYVNGQPLVRKGDKTKHCEVTVGEMIEASGDVNDNSPRQSLIAQKLKAIAQAVMQFQDLAEGFAPGPGEDPREAALGPKMSFLDELEKVSPYLDIARHTAESKLDSVAKSLAKDAKIIQRFEVKPPTNPADIKAWKKARAKFYRQQEFERAAKLEASGRAEKAAKFLGKAGDVLNIATAGLHGYLQYRDSHNATTGGRIANGAAAGVFNGIYGAALPEVATVDAVTGGHVAQNFDGAAGATTSLAEAAITGNTRGAQAFNDASLHGDYGPVFQAASQAGEYWAHYGVVGGLENAASNAWNDVFG